MGPQDYYEEKKWQKLFRKLDQKTEARKMNRTNFRPAYRATTAKNGGI